MARILVVDDEEGVRSFVAECLELAGHAVQQADSGESALVCLRTRTFDLVFTDMRMPGIDGIELLRTARGEQPELEFIVLTAHGNVDTAVEAMRLGAFDFVQKPVSGPDEVRILASRALERRALLDLRDRAERDTGAVSLSYGDPAMEAVTRAIAKVAPTNATVLLVGESGTGKEVAANAIHRSSDRADGPFVVVNCATLSSTLLESELFGHEKGAFTGATSRKRGRVELAHGGTFFLDEIGELKPDLQAKLLRVVQERCFERVGGTRPIESDVRWIAATNRDLGAMIREGTFREDLYHRLAVFPLRLPPLRERPSDIPALADTLLAGVARDLKRPGLRLSDAAKRDLGAAPWPGNVRELANVLERAAILCDHDVIEPSHLLTDPFAAPAQIATTAPPPAHGHKLADLERHAIEAALADLEGNRRLAAERLGIGLRTLYDKIKRYGIE